MPLERLIQFRCDYCGHCDYCLPPLAYAKQNFIELGYLHVNGRWYCDTKCKDNHTVQLKENRRAETDAA